MDIPIKESKDKVNTIIVPDEFRSVFYDEELNLDEFAFMANHEPTFTLDPDSSTGLLVTDCGATSTLTNSFANMSEDVSEVVRIQLADEGATLSTVTLHSLHHCLKTYYILDPTSMPWAVNTRAWYVKI